MTAAAPPYAAPGIPPEDAGRLNRFRATLLAGSGFAVGVAVQIHNGEYTFPSLVLVTLALLATATAVQAASGPAPSLVGMRTTLQAMILLQLFALLTRWPGDDLPHGGRFQLVPLCVATVAVGAIVLFGSDARSRIAFPLILLLAAAIFVWMIRSSPNPHIDVWVFQQQAADRLVHGGNPYAMTFPDIYHSTLPGHQRVYGPGLVLNDRLQFGFPYPPASLFLSTLGWLLAGDHRYAQAAAVVLGGAWIGYSRSGSIAKLAAVLFLFTPRMLFVLGRGWTEPFSVMLLAATVFLACRRSMWTPIALGLFLATKQYLLLTLPLTFLLLPAGWRMRDWLIFLGKAVAVAALITLPMALWNPSAFWHSTVTVQEQAPFRWDALSYLVWYGFRHHVVDLPWIAPLWSSLAAATALVIAARRAPREPGGFAAATALVLGAFFSFNKQAFCNYYFLVIGAMCCAAAALAVPGDGTAESDAVLSHGDVHRPG